MFGFHGIGESAINEFLPDAFEHAPKTCRVFLIPAYRLGELAVRAVYRAVVRIVP